MNTAEAAQEILAALAGGPPVVEVLVMDSPTSVVPVGTRMVVRATSASGSLGDTEADARVRELSREVLRTRRPRQERIDTPAGPVTVYLEPHFAPDELVIVGAGHIARPLCRIGAMLGYAVTVLDDRPDFATLERFPEAVQLVKADFSDPFRGVALGAGTHLVLVTRGHKYDYDALRDIMLRGVDLAYVGMVGSQRRVRATLEQLRREGISTERLAAVYSPIGLDIEAETPEEIAISIAAELVRVRRGGTGVSMRDRARVVERFLRHNHPSGEA
ncbi:MAG: XdhC/CoxI family protein [Gemmatimonadota bacterium]|jgi:xanthine dehydrogenase accessory factor|nr:XdhC/CoxI family protein [Gemmatimonadota bacterium]